MSGNKTIGKRTVIALSLLCVALLGALIGVIVNYTLMINGIENEIQVLTHSGTASYVVWREADM